MTIEFLPLSDRHLVAPGHLIAGVDPRRRMHDVLARITHLDVSPAFVDSSDLTDDGSAESDEVVTGVLREIGREDTPVLLALGNDRDRVTFHLVVPVDHPVSHAHDLSRLGYAID